MGRSGLPQEDAEAKVCMIALFLSSGRRLRLGLMTIWLSGIGSEIVRNAESRALQSSAAHELTKLHLLSFV